ncbi:MAG TPA: hypothetical protein VNX21_06785 [Candidatus Thermoplasmatota archaeon]|nr:hypothetical protein [Candidatus Thermoplasmatota archaeon]
MLEKLRSRHPIDVPAEDWGRSRGLLGALGTLALLFLALPLLGTLAAAALAYRNGEGAGWLLGAAAAIAALMLVILVAGARGKPGHARR